MGNMGAAMVRTMAMGLRASSSFLPTPGIRENRRVPQKVDITRFIDENPMDVLGLVHDVLLQDPTSEEIAGNPSLTCVRDFSFGEGQSKKIYCR